MYKKYSRLALGILFIFALMSNLIPVMAELEINLNSNSAYYGDVVVVSVSNGKPNTVVTLWIMNSANNQVWADQSMFSSEGKYSYNFTVPDDWELGEYSIYVRNAQSDNVQSTPISISEVVTQFELSGLSVTPSEVEAGEEVTISITVKNVGDIEATYLVELIIDDVPVDSESVTLEVEASTDVSFTTSSSVVGSHSVSIGTENDDYNVKQPESEPFSIPPIVVDLGIILLVVGAIALLRRTGTI